MFAAFTTWDLGQMWDYTTLFLIIAIMCWLGWAYNRIQLTIFRRKPVVSVPSDGEEPSYWASYAEEAVREQIDSGLLEPESPEDVTEEETRIMHERARSSRESRVWQDSHRRQRVAVCETLTWWFFRASLVTSAVSLLFVGMYVRGYFLIYK